VFGNRVCFRLPVKERRRLLWWVSYKDLTSITVSETLCFLVNQNSRRWTKFIISGILIVIHHPQNRLLGRKCLDQLNDISNRGKVWISGLNYLKEFLMLA
jgi:hypothetical protein